MNRKKLFTIIGLMLFPVFCVLTASFAGWLYFGLTFWDGLDDWSIEDQPWIDAEIPISSEGVRIIFQARASHPLLAEYDYRLRIEDGVSVKEIPLTPNSGGQINEAVYLTTYEERRFLDVRGSVVDLQSFEEIKDISTKYYPLVFGERVWVGNITFTDSKLGLNNAEKFSEHFLTEAEKFPSDEVVLGDHSKMRVVKASEITLLRYIHIENENDHDYFAYIYEDEQEELFYLVKYRERLFVMNRSIALNVDNQVLIETEGTTFIYEGSSEAQIEYGNPFLNQIWKEGEVIKQFKI